MFPAYAKINLGLLVLKKRPDGYHDILTVFHRIDLFDRISLAYGADISVISTSPEAPSDESNICHKAARLLREALGVRSGVTITIDKRIPVGAGLGGGSSDAATVLRHLPAFWGCSSMELPQLRKLALEIGSDVPYFLGAGSAVAHGRGEILEYFPFDMPYSIVLCNPNIHVSTGWAYEQLRPSEGRQEPDLKNLILQGAEDPRILRERLMNDFEPAVFRAYPEIARLKDKMIAAGAVYASMSGSGSSVYGLFTDGEDAEHLATQLRAGDYLTFVTPPHFVPAE